jgi:hypothetical protein
VRNIRPADCDLSTLLKAESKTIQSVISPVLGHIDAIHRVPALPSIPVVREGSDIKPGAYEYIKSSGRPVKIGLQLDSLTPRLTFAHEVWHFIEHQGIATIGAFETETDPHLRPVLAATRSTDTAKYLKMLQGRRRWPVDFADGSRGNNDIDHRYVEYLLQPRELLARGYAQYVAFKSGDPVMANELARIRRRPARSIYYPEQWDDHEFGAIAEAFDRVILEFGWQK